MCYVTGAVGRRWTQAVIRQKTSGLIETQVSSLLHRVSNVADLTAISLTGARTQLTD
jgi:hypothetical protein